MKKNVLKRERIKRYSANCRIGRFFSFPDRQGYGGNTSASAKKAFPTEAAGIIRAGSHCRIKPLIH
jgi:hypothetical protein